MQLVFKSQPARLAFDHVPEVRGTMIYDLRGLEYFPTLPYVDGVLSSGIIQPNNGIEEPLFYIWNSVVKTIYLARA